jgi:iron(III) transport system permease protein
LPEFQLKAARRQHPRMQPLRSNATVLKTEGPHSLDRSPLTRPLGVSRDRAFGVLVIVVIGAVTFAPVLFVLIDSFNVSGTGEPFRFGLKGWAEIFASSKTGSSIGYSFLLSIRIPIGIAIAFVIAWLLVRVEIPGHRFIEHALWFGFFLPLLPMTMGWVLLLDANYGLINAVLRKTPFIHRALFSIYSVPGIIWVHLSLSTVPVMVILLAPALRNLDAANEEAADVSGASVFATLRCITIPLILPAILTAFIAGFIRSLEVFEVEQFLGTPAGILVYSTRIYDLIASEPPLYPQAMALSALFLAILLVVALIYQHYVARLGNRATLSGKGTRLQRRRGGRWASAASAVILLYIAISIGLPLVVLILGSFCRLFGFFFLDGAWTTSHWREVFADRAFVRATISSVVIGLAAGVIGTLAYALIAWLLVRKRLWGGAAVSLLIWLPWAIPGIVLGLTLSTIILNTAGLSALYGTAVPLVVAMIIKGMPIGVQMIRTSLLQISRDIDEAAQISGARFVAIFRRITLPLLAPMCTAVFLLVFMATLSDISTLVLLAAPGTRTLSLLMFEFATSSRPEAAAVIGVIIAVLCLVITSISFRVGLRMSVER